MKGLYIIISLGIVSESIAEDPIVANSRRTQELGLFYGKLWHIFHLDLHLHLYKIQLMQELKPTDYSERRRYVKWVLEQQAVDGNFSNKIFFSDEAHLTPGEYVNK